MLEVLHWESDFCPTPLRPAAGDPLSPRDAPGGVWGGGGGLTGDLPCVAFPTSVVLGTVQTSLSWDRDGRDRNVEAALVSTGTGRRRLEKRLGGYFCRVPTGWRAVGGRTDGVGRADRHPERRGGTFGIFGFVWDYWNLDFGKIPKILKIPEIAKGEGVPSPSSASLPRAPLPRSPAGHKEEALQRLQKPLIPGDVPQHLFHGSLSSVPHNIRRQYPVHATVHCNSGERGLSACVPVPPPPSNWAPRAGPTRSHAGHLELLNKMVRHKMWANLVGSSAPDKRQSLDVATAPAPGRMNDLSPEPFRNKS